MAVPLPKSPDEQFKFTNLKLDKFINDSKIRYDQNKDLMNRFMFEIRTIAGKPTNNTPIKEPDSSTNQPAPVLPTVPTKTEMPVPKSNSESTNAWVPPTGEESTSKAKKPVGEDKDSTKSFLSKIWNKIEAKEAFDAKDTMTGRKQPFMGALLNGIVAGITTSPAMLALMQSPWVKLLKFIFTPAGMMLIYFIYKWVKKNVWDPIYTSIIGPTISWIKDVIVPPLMKGLDWLTNTLWPWIKSMLPTMDEVKSAFKMVWDAFSSPGTFLEKFVNVLVATGNLLDTLFSPITNLIKEGQVAILTMFAQILDGLYMKEAAASLMGSAQVAVSSMHGAFKEEQQKKLQQSDIGQAYAAQVNPEVADELNKKMRSGNYKPTAIEKEILNSNYYKNKYGDSTLTKAGLNKADLEALVRGNKAKYGDQESPAIASKEVMQQYESKGLRTSSRMISELRTKKGMNEQEMQTYMKTILDNNTDLSRSADAQQAVLDELKDMMKKNDVKSDKLNAELAAAQRQVSDTRNINNTMINTVLPEAGRTERGLRTNSSVYNTP